MNKQILIRNAALFSSALVATAAAFAQGTLQQRPATLQQPPAAIQQPAGTLQQPQGTLLRPRTGVLMDRAAQCMINELTLRFTTGDDDLRGGNDNLDVEVHYANGDMQTTQNVNNGANWPNNSVKAVAVHLNHAVAPNQITEIRLVHSAQGGYNTPTTGQIVENSTPVVGPIFATSNTLSNIQSEDNWKMTEFQAFGIVNGATLPVASFGFHKFTGSDPVLSIPAHPPAGCPTGNQVVRIDFTFWTADDDLRGGNDNLGITVLFSDGTSQTESNVNHSANWPNGSTRGAEILLDHSVTMSQIRGFTLFDTFTGGPGGDNWNMASMQADAVLADGSTHTIAKFGYHKFSADWSGPKAKQISIRAQLIN